MTLALADGGGAFLSNHIMLFLFQGRLTGTEAGGMPFRYKERLLYGKAVTRWIFPSEAEYASVNTGEGVAFIIADHSPYWRYGIARMPLVKAKFGTWKFSPHMTGLDGYAAYRRIQGDYYVFSLVVLH